VRLRPLIPHRSAGSKAGTAMYKPFNVNSIGGRLELSPATALADTGTYDFDIQVSNIKGVKTINSVSKSNSYAGCSLPDRQAVCQYIRAQPGNRIHYPGLISQ